MTGGISTAHCGALSALVEPDWTLEALLLREQTTDSLSFRRFEMSRRTESISSIAVVYSERDFSSFIQNCDFLTDNDAITVAVKSFNELLTFKVGLITF